MCIRHTLMLGQRRICSFGRYPLLPLKSAYSETRVRKPHLAEPTSGSPTRLRTALWNTDRSCTRKRGSDKVPIETHRRALTKGLSHAGPYHPSASSWLRPPAPPPPCSWPLPLPSPDLPSTPPQPRRAGGAPGTGGHRARPESLSLIHI